MTDECATTQILWLGYKETWRAEMFTGRKTIVAIAAMLIVPAVLIAGDDPLYGTWKLNQTKSNFGGRPSPGELTRVYEPIPNGVRIVRELEGPDGKPTTGGWAIPFDGKDHVVKG